MTNLKNAYSEISPMPRIASAPRRKVFVRDLELSAFIGVYDNETGRAAICEYQS